MVSLNSPLQGFFFIYFYLVDIQFWKRGLQRGTRHRASLFSAAIDFCLVLTALELLDSAKHKAQPEH